MIVRPLRGQSSVLTKHIRNPPSLPYSHPLHPVSAYASGRGRSYATASQDKREKVVILGSGWAGISTQFFGLACADENTYRLCAIATARYIKVQAISDITSILLRLHTSPE